MFSDMAQRAKYRLQAVGNSENIRTNILNIRKSRGLTQEDVAKRIGITQSLYSAYERGRLGISAEMLAQISVALKAASDEILGISHQEDTESIDGRLIRRLKKIEALPVHQRRALITNIDMFLKGVANPKGEGTASLEEEECG